jgi:Staphylococcal nuclease homologue
MSVGYSRFSTLGEDERYHFDAASRRVLDGHAQVYTAEITVAAIDETFLGEREYVVRLLEVDTPERGADYEGWKAAVDWVKDFLTEQDDQGKTVPIEGGQLTLTGQRDVYGRHLGWFELNGIDLSHELASRGLGTAQPLEQHVGQLAVDYEWGEA